MTDNLSWLEKLILFTNKSFVKELTNKNYSLTTKEKPTILAENWKNQSEKKFLIKTKWQTGLLTKRV
jgi:hypothetical protein